MDTDPIRTAAPGRRSRPAGGGVFLVALCSAAYFTSYLTRKSYDASIPAILEATGLARTAASLASTAAVVVYGSGQFVTGLLADRLDPRKLVFAAMLVTAACNAAMPAVAGCVPAMAAIWAVNGFAQAMFWPPIVKIVASNLPADRYKDAVFWISASCNAAIVTVFVLVSGCIRFAGWRASFAVVAAIALGMAALWRASIGRAAPAAHRAAPPRPADRAADARGGGLPLGALLAAAGIFPVMAAIVCQGVIRDGIEVWASSIVKEQYGLGTSGSIFSVALLPVFAVASMAAARAIRRLLGDEVKAALALFVSALCCAAFLFAADGATLAVGLPALALLSASMHGANLMLIGELPGRFARQGRVGTVSGLLNAFTYVGAAVAIYGFAAVRETLDRGWHPVYALWIGVLGLGIALLLAALRRWRRFRAEEEAASRAA